MLGLYRAPGQPLFAAEDLRFLHDVSLYLAEGARRGLLVGKATDPEGSDASGLVVLKDDWSIESLTPGATDWLAELPGDWEVRGALPPAVLAVAGRALRSAEHPDVPDEIAFARALSRAGRWMVLHGAALVATGARTPDRSIQPDQGKQLASCPRP